MVDETCRWLLAGVLLTAATAKVRDIPSFVAAARTMLGSSSRLVGPAAFVVVAVEAVLGVGLLSGVFLAAGATVAAVLFAGFAGFAGVVVATLRAGRQAPCACFGTGSGKPITADQAVLDLALVLASIVVLATDGRDDTAMTHPGPILFAVFVASSWALLVRYRRVLIAHHLLDGRLTELAR